jgi:ribosomal protein S18 acetylase RimI-like enzyme
MNASSTKRRTERHRSPNPVRLRREHLPEALALSRALEWPYRGEDWQFAFNLGRGFAVEIDGKLAGTALWWPYGEDFASTGMVIVSSQYQRRGIGRALMDTLLADSAGRSIILNSTEEGLKLYQSLGFVAHGHITKHQAFLARAPADGLSGVVRNFRPADRPAVYDLDRSGSGMDRRRLIDALLEIGEFKLVERDGRISGYGCARVWGRGIVIGPVVAADNGDAQAIIGALAASYVGQFVRIDVPNSVGLSPWLESIGLPKVDEEVAMVLGSPPARNADTALFALTNQSLG